jgi:hypothetical protein
MAVFSAHLTLDDFKTINQCNLVPDFTFIVNKENYAIPIVYAELLSPKVRTLRKSDPTVDTFSLTIEEEVQDSILEGSAACSVCSVFSSIAGSVRGFSVEVTESTSPIIARIGSVLGNDTLVSWSLKVIEQRGSPSSCCDVSKAIVALDQKASHGLDASSESAFVASRFGTFDLSVLCRCSVAASDCVLGSPSLRVESESEVLSLVLSCMGVGVGGAADCGASRAAEYSPLLRHVYAEHLHADHVGRLLSLRCHALLVPSILDCVERRLTLSASSAPQCDGRVRSRREVRVDLKMEDKSPFEGIVGHLLGVSGSCGADCGSQAGGIIEAVSSSGVCLGGDASCVVDGHGR